MATQNIHLAPCSKQQGDAKAYQHLQESVVEGINLDAFETEISRRNGKTAVWGLTEGNSNRWKRVEKEDYLLFYVGNEEYEYAAKVIGREYNPELAEKIWPDYLIGSAGGDDPNDPWEYIIYLDDPIKLNLDSKIVHRAAGYKENFPRRFMRLNDEGISTLEKKYGSLDEFVHSEAIEEGESGTTAADREEQVADLKPPKRVDTQISRIIRNTQVAKNVKERYNHQCQICGGVRWRNQDQPYAEAHHIHPLGANPPGLDIEENVIVLCPNHHADFDYGMVRIDPETFQIEHIYDSQISGRKLDVKDEHQIREKFTTLSQ